MKKVAKVLVVNNDDADMFWTNTPLDYFYIVLFTHLFDKFPCSLTDIPGKDLESVFGNPTDMILMVVNCVISLSFIFHNTEHSTIELCTWKVQIKTGGIHPSPLLSP